MFLGSYTYVLVVGVILPSVIDTPLGICLHHLNQSVKHYIGLQSFSILVIK